MPPYRYSAVLLLHFPCTSHVCMLPSGRDRHELHARQVLQPHHCEPIESMRPPHGRAPRGVLSSFKLEAPPWFILSHACLRKAAIKLSVGSMVHRHHRLPFAVCSISFCRAIAPCLVAPGAMSNMRPDTSMFVQLLPQNSATITADAREQQAALPPAREILFQAVRLSCGQQAHQAVVPIRKLAEQAYDR